MPTQKLTELLVQFAADIHPARIDAAAAAIGGKILESIDTPALALAGEGSLVRMRIGQGLDLEQAIEILNKRAAVVFAEPDWQVSIAATSDDPGYVNGSLWGMYGDASTPANQYGSQSAEAWSASHLGASDTVIGVIDTGIDYKHPDLY